MWGRPRWPLGGAAFCRTGSRAACFRLGLSVVFVVSSSRTLRVSSPSLCSFLAAQMYRAPVRPQRSPGAPRPAGRFPSPASCWGFPGTRSPYGGSPRGGPAHSPGSPSYSPGSNRGYRDGSPFGGFGGGSRGFGDTPAGFGGGSRGFGGPTWRRGGGFRRPQSFSPASAQNLQVKFQVNTESRAPSNTSTSRVRLMDQFKWKTSCG